MNSIRCYFLFEGYDLQMLEIKKIIDYLQGRDNMVFGELQKVILLRHRLMKENILSVLNTNRNLSNER